MRFSTCTTTPRQAQAPRNACWPSPTRRWFPGGAGAWHSTHYDTLASFNMTMVREVGPWDTILPNYFADNDYYRRLRLAGYEVIETSLPVTHVGGGINTINSDPRRRFLNGVAYPLYERYYAAKWGGTPGREMYVQPFNGAI